ncbi:MAG: DUF3343 domain-containing protein [Clostridiales bacterium]|nr:DUF3343 domain-containing protein [Clostridiales bacterium]
MNKHGIKVGSVTYAMKGRELLAKNGFKVYISRNPKPVKNEGCGYMICVSGNIDVALAILERENVKVNGIEDGCDFK